MFDAARHRPDPNRFPNNELILDDYEKPINEIANQMLGAESYCQARQARGSRNGGDIKTELWQRRKDRADNDDGGSRAVEQSRQSLYVMLVHTRNPAQALAPCGRDQASCQGTQQPVQYQGDQQNRDDANSSRGCKIRPFGYVWSHNTRR
jgi:hypothetical protein